MTDQSIPKPSALLRNCAKELAEWRHWKKTYSGNGVGFQEFWDGLTEEQKDTFLPGGRDDWATNKGES